MLVIFLNSPAAISCSNVRSLAGSSPVVSEVVVVQSFIMTSSKGLFRLREELFHKHLRLCQNLEDPLRTRLLAIVQLFSYFRLGHGKWIRSFLFKKICIDN